MQGKLYGVGVGPGDPELLTLKALRLMKEADIIAVPGENPKESVAYQIAVKAYEKLSEKELIAISMPMIRDKKELAAAHDKAAKKIAELLESGKKIVFLTLGDPTVYSTYLYIHKRIVKAGYIAEIVNGIPSFCAVAAKLNYGLVENDEALHVIPSAEQVEEALHYSGTKVFMKAGKTIDKIKQSLIQNNTSAMMIENCGMPNEKTYLTVEDIPENAGYYSLIIVK